MDAASESQTAHIASAVIPGYGARQIITECGNPQSELMHAESVPAPERTALPTASENDDVGDLIHENRVGSWGQGSGSKTVSASMLDVDGEEMRGAKDSEPVCETETPGFHWHDAPPRDHTDSGIEAHGDTDAFGRCETPPRQRPRPRPRLQQRARTRVAQVETPDSASFTTQPVFQDEHRMHVLACESERGDREEGCTQAAALRACRAKGTEDLKLYDNELAGHAQSPQSKNEHLTTRPCGIAREELPSVFAFAPSGGTVACWDEVVRATLYIGLARALADVR